MADDLADLARRWSRALHRGRGIRLEAADLDQLAAIGVNDIIQAAAAEFLKEKAKCRDGQRRGDYTHAVTTGSTGTGGPTVVFDPPISPYSGTTQSEDAHALLAHAQTISQPRARRSTGTT
ncbi:hypothetical protein M9978_17485 [Sphingomonas sp. MG17]|uniref:Uncharacterized protein n=1 Tax=Sphingomonas tagetis TaxID=2949092 RepID=A0A9X2HPL5_9SPHN|nr:hypothetical protein [Sphingomonas tagetis]MCP3732216.1 hypothetical protein [Sphingomonas tagetis]